MTHYQSLETEKYWNDAIEAEAMQELASRNRNAIEAFVTFLLGLALVAAFNLAFHYWYI
jgi:hypothetical protein